MVVAGKGLLTPLGASLERSWDGLVNGRSGIRPITAFDASGCDTRIAGEVPDLFQRFA